MIMYINMFKYMNSDSHHWRMPLVFLSNHSNYPTSYTNFANFDPVWMKLGVEIKNGQRS